MVVEPPSHVTMTRWPPPRLSPPWRRLSVLALREILTWTAAEPSVAPAAQVTPTSLGDTTAENPPAVRVPGAGEPAVWTTTNVVMAAAPRAIAPISFRCFDIEVPLLAGGT